MDPRDDPTPTSEIIALTTEIAAMPEPQLEREQALNAAALLAARRALGQAYRREALLRAEVIRRRAQARRTAGA